MSIEFLQKAKEKFDKGAIEHSDQGWERMTRDQIIAELMEEFLDIYNYCNHPKLRDDIIFERNRMIAMREYENLYIISNTGKEIDDGFSTDKTLQDPEKGIE